MFLFWGGAWCWVCREVGRSWGEEKYSQNTLYENILNPCFINRAPEPQRIKSEAVYFITMWKLPSAQTDVSAACMQRRVLSHNESKSPPFLSFLAGQLEGDNLTDHRSPTHHSFSYPLSFSWEHTLHGLLLYILHPFDFKLIRRVTLYASLAASTFVLVLLALESSKFSSVWVGGA